jgi:hypothetical protein
MMGLWSDVSLLWPITEEGSNEYGQEISKCKNKDVNIVKIWTQTYKSLKHTDMSTDVKLTEA